MVPTSESEEFEASRPINHLIRHHKRNIIDIIGLDQAQLVVMQFVEETFWVEGKVKINFRWYRGRSRCWQGNRPPTLSNYEFPIFGSFLNQIHSWWILRLERGDPKCGHEAIFYRGSKLEETLSNSVNNEEGSITHITSERRFQLHISNIQTQPKTMDPSILIVWIYKLWVGKDTKLWFPISHLILLYFSRCQIALS